MLENILIVDATMIVGVLFVEAIGRAIGIKVTWGMGRWMFIWGVVALLPFSVSSVLALAGNDLAIGSAGIGFIGFTTWFLLISFAVGKEKTSGQMVVEENELDKWLKEGHVVVAVLKSGRVVIE
jgi:hypothetical protein